MVKRAGKQGFYTFLVTLPDRLYPFSAVISGKRVRGRRAYDYALSHAIKRYGGGHFGPTLLTYRQLFHFVGSILFIISVTLLSKMFFGSDVAIYVLLAAAIGAITFQEFYLHPRIYNQHFLKGVSDWLAWMIPIGVYLFIHLH